MKEEWLMWWGWKFLKIAVYQTIFSWQFVGTVLVVALVYMAMIFFQKDSAAAANGKPKRKFFRFRFRDVLFYLGVTVFGLIIILALAVSITLHANSYAEAMEKGCLTVTETNDSYKFQLPDGCVPQSVLWNQVVLDQQEGRPAYDFLTNNNKR